MNGTTLTIRPVERADYPAWRSLFDGYNAFYGRSGNTSLPEEVTQTTWSRFFDYYEPMHALLAEREDELIGLVHFLYHRSTTHIAPLCYLQDLFTAPSVRGQGAVAMKLYDRLAEQSGFIVYRHTL